MAWLRCEKHLYNYKSPLGCPLCDKESKQKPTKKDIESKIVELEAKLARLSSMITPQRDDTFNFETNEIKNTQIEQQNQLPEWYNNITGYSAKQTEKTLPQLQPLTTKGTLPKGFGQSIITTKTKVKEKKPSLFKQVLLALKIAEMK